MRRLLLALLVLAACHVTPLPVPNADEWQPGYGGTDYPPLVAGHPADAGADGAKNTTRGGR